MRKNGLLLPVLLLSLLVTGCAKKEAETEVQTEAPTEAVTEVQTEKQTEKQTEPETEKETEPQIEDSMNKTRSMIGLVKSSDTSKLVVQTERGKELSFAITGADVQVTGGIAAGENVKILYKGVIADTDTSDAKVLMVKNIDATETPVTEGELMTEAEEADPNAGAGTLEGTISDVNATRIVIVSNDGDSYYFSLFGADVNLIHSIQKGNYVTVNYDGDIYGPDLVTATSVSDTADGEEKAAYGPAQEGEYTYVNGVITDAAIDSITIESDDGEELVFDITDATVGMYNGIVAGNYVTFECEGTVEGTDTSKAAVLAVYDYEDNDLSVSYSDDEEYYDDGEYDEYYEDEEEYYEE